MTIDLVKITDLKKLSHVFEFLEIISEFWIVYDYNSRD